MNTTRSKKKDSKQTVNPVRNFRNKEKRQDGALKISNGAKYTGTHLMVEFWGGKIIENPKEIKNILIEAAKISRNVPLGVKIHKFHPQGLTGFILLAESHISLHTWPQMKYVAVDIFSCGKKSRPYQGLEYLKKKFQPKKVKVITIKRG